MDVSTGVDANEDSRVVEDVDTLKALADPARLAILEMVMGGYERTFTAKELAAAAGMGAKKVYYHLNLLEQQGLLKVRGTQVVNGIIEKHYGAGQRRVTFQRGRDDATISAAPDGSDRSSELEQVVLAVFDQVKTNLAEDMRDGIAVMRRDAPDRKRAVVSYTMVGMDPARAGEFRDALLKLIADFRAANTPGAPGFELLVAIHPRGLSMPTDTRDE